MAGVRLSRSQPQVRLVMRHAGAAFGISPAAVAGLALARHKLRGGDDIRGGRRRDRRLAATAFLHRAGPRATAYEQAAELRE